MTRWMIGSLAVASACGRPAQAPAQAPAPAPAAGSDAFSDAVGFDVASMPTTARSDAAHRISVGQPTFAAAGGDEVQLRRALKQRLVELDGCYRTQLGKAPALAGTITLAFTITATGAVMNATADGVDPDLAGCMAAVVRTISFPAPANGQDVVVTAYPLRLTPGDAP